MNFSSIVKAEKSFFFKKKFEWDICSHNLLIINQVAKKNS